MLFYHPIGSEKGFLSGSIKDSGVLFLDQVFVFREFRGQRLAAKAMAEIVHMAIKNGFKKISLQAIPYDDFSDSKSC
jgi:GNAT superfamily N-acetyltransferase